MYLFRFVMIILFFIISSLSYAFAQNQKIKILVMIDSVENLKFSAPFKALGFADKALKLSIKTGDSSLIAQSTFQVGNCYYMLSKDATAMDFFLKSIDISMKIKDKNLLAKSQTSMGLIYGYQNQFEKALSYFNSAYDNAKSVNDTAMFFKSLRGLGWVYNLKKDYEKAHEKLSACLRFDKYKTPLLFIELGKANNGLNNIESAMIYANKALDLSIENGDIMIIGEAYLLIGEINTNSKDYKFALTNYIKSYSCFENVRSIYDMMVLELYISQTYAKLKQYDKAYSHHVLYTSLCDSFAEHSNIKEVQIKYEKQLERIKYDNEVKLQKETISRKEAESKKQQAETEKQRAQRNLFIIGFGLMIILAIIVLRSYRQKKKANTLLFKQKQVIEEKNTEIMDSITYAKRIQSAILPPSKLVKKYLKESFILYKPKDIVAGDFYWMEHKDGKVLFAAADCTGHGVPGAMVSVICNNALNRSVREYGLTDPGQILDKTREIVIQEFEKSDEEVKDGMDIALCSLDENELKYAGANNPLWIVRNNEILETKANKQPIGKFDNPLPYTTHSFDLQKGDSIYIFSDGYVDQFGGEKGKKFKAKAFRALLLGMQDQELEKQRLLIDECFENWRGELEQIDDVVVLCVKV